MMTETQELLESLLLRVQGFRLVEVGPDVVGDVPRELQDLEEHDDGDSGE